MGNRAGIVVFGLVPFCAGFLAVCGANGLKRFAVNRHHSAGNNLLSGEERPAGRSGGLR